MIGRHLSSCLPPGGTPALFALLLLSACSAFKATRVVTLEDVPVSESFWRAEGEAQEPLFVETTAALVAKRQLKTAILVEPALEGHVQRELEAALGVEEAGYSINIITKAMSDSDLLAIFRSRQADAVILLEVLTDDERAEVLRRHGYPFVMVGHRVDSEGMSFVDVDLRHGIDVALEHLAGLGHRRIGFLSLDPVVDGKTYGYATWALQVYEQACERMGLDDLAAIGGLTPDDMSEVAQQLIGQHADITAFIALQDQSVIGLLRAARALDLRVPDDLSIVGMTTEPMAEIATPPLTTVGFPEHEMGRTAARLLLDLIDSGQSTSEQVFVKPKLTVRESTASPRTRGDR